MNWRRTVLVWLVVVFPACLFLIPTTVLLVEFLASLLPDRSQVPTKERPRVAILVPAHNEQGVVEDTLIHLVPQMSPGDRLLVVADNCDDGTAKAAFEFGAEVVTRTDPARIGKGFAVDLGLRTLAEQPPDVVLIIDADCRVTEGSIDALAIQSASLERPVQAAYLMPAPTGAGWMAGISEFAVLVKNYVRPLGLTRLGLPCLLNGSGMAIPWQIVRRIKIATPSIAEDTLMGINYALLGRSATLLRTAKVTGVLPTVRSANYEQRRQWEHGHLQTLFTQVPRLMAAAVRQRRLGLAALGLELCVPPLSLLVSAIFMTTVVAFALGWYLPGLPPWPVSVLLGSEVTALAIVIFGSWFVYGRELLPVKSLFAVPLYLAWKLPIYLAFVFRRQRIWVRTQRRVS